MASVKKTLSYSFTIPTAEQLFKDSNNFPLKSMVELLRKYSHGEIKFNLFATDSEKEEALTLTELITWINNIESLLFDLNYSFSFVNYYYDNSAIVSKSSSGKPGNPFEHFEGQDYHSLEMYRFYAEIIFIKLFTVLDNLAFILEYCSGRRDILDSEKRLNIHFKNTVERLSKDQNNTIAIEVKSFIQNDKFNKSLKLRNDLAHNRSPLIFKSIMKQVQENGMTMLVAKEINTSVEESFSLMNYLIFSIMVPSIEKVCLEMEDKVFKK